MPNQNLTNNPCCVETLKKPLLTEDGLPTTDRGEIVLITEGRHHRFPTCSKGLVWMDGKGGAIVCENIAVDLPAWLNYLRQNGQIVKNRGGEPLEGTPPSFPYLLIGVEAQGAKGETILKWHKVRGATGEEAYLHWNGDNYEFAGLYDEGVATTAEIAALNEITLAGWKPLNAAQVASLKENPNLHLKRVLAQLQASGVHGLLHLSPNALGELTAKVLTGNGLVEVQADGEPALHPLSDLFPVPSESGTYLRIRTANGESTVTVPQTAADAGKMWVLGITGGLPAFEQVYIPAEP